MSQVNAGPAAVSLELFPRSLWLLRLGLELCEGSLLLTQLHVLVVRHDQHDVGPDVAAVPLNAGLQALASGAVG